MPEEACYLGRKGAISRGWHSTWQKENEACLTNGGGDSTWQKENEACLTNGGGILPGRRRVRHALLMEGIPPGRRSRDGM